MSDRYRNKKFRLTPKLLVRLIVFTLIVSASIYYFSTQNINNSPINTNILGEQTFIPSDMPLVKTVIDNLYAQLPADSRNLIENINKLPIISLTLDKIDYLKSEVAGFPQKQIKDLKLFIINKGQELLNSAVDKTK